MAPKKKSRGRKSAKRAAKPPVVREVPSEGGQTQDRGAPRTPAARRVEPDERGEMAEERGVEEASPAEDRPEKEQAGRRTEPGRLPPSENPHRRPRREDEGEDRGDDEREVEDFR